MLSPHTEIPLFWPCAGVDFSLWHCIAATLSSCCDLDLTIHALNSFISIREQRSSNPAMPHTPQTRPQERDCTNFWNLRTIFKTSTSSREFRSASFTPIERASSTKHNAASKADSSRCVHRKSRKLPVSILVGLTWRSWLGLTWRSWLRLTWRSLLGFTWRSWLGFKWRSWLGFTWRSDRRHFEVFCFLRISRLRNCITFFRCFSSFSKSRSFSTNLSETSCIFNCFLITVKLQCTRSDAFNLILAQNGPGSCNQEMQLCPCLPDLLLRPYQLRGKCNSARI